METKNDDRVSRYLVETEWLASHLDDPDLRILDCTVFLHYMDNGRAYIESGRSAWQEGHIPGSTFIDLFEEVADRESEFFFTKPSALQFSAAMSRHGVGTHTRVILYDEAMTSGATCLWWLLRAFGFDNAAVLNGGWKKWRLEKRPLSVEPTIPSPGNFAAHSRSELLARKEEVLAALDNRATCLINALNESQYRELHIPSSINIPATSLLDPQTSTYLPLETLRRRFEQIGLDCEERVITYCDSGIWASGVAHILTLLGIENVAVYDGSMMEWMADTSMPVEIG